MFNPFTNLIRRSRTLGTHVVPFLFASNGKPIDDTIDVTPEYALRNSDVFAIVLRVSSDIASCDFITTNYYKKLLNKPFGNVVSSYSLWQSIIVQLMLYGNAYAWLHKASNGTITSIEPIPYAQVQVALSDNGDDIIYTAHFDDANRNGDVEINSSDMLHFRLLVNGEGGSIQYMGLSPLIALKNEVAIQDKSNKLSLATLAHAISPTNIIKVPEAQLNRDAKNSIREEFERANTGENAGRAVVLDQSADLQQVSISPDIAKFIANTSFSQEQIAKAFCIPADFLSGKQDAQSSIDSIRSFYQSSLSIYFKTIESELTSKLGVDVELDIGGAIDNDHQQVIDNLDKLGKDKLLSSDEVQKILQARNIFPELTSQDIALAHTYLMN